MSKLEEMARLGAKVSMGLGLGLGLGLGMGLGLGIDTVKTCQSSKPICRFSITRTTRQRSE